MFSDGAAYRAKNENEGGGGVLPIRGVGAWAYRTCDAVEEHPHVGTPWMVVDGGGEGPVRVMTLRTCRGGLRGKPVEHHLLYAGGPAADGASASSSPTSATNPRRRLFSSPSSGHPPSTSLLFSTAKRDITSCTTHVITKDLLLVG